MFVSGLSVRCSAVSCLDRACVLSEVEILIPYGVRHRFKHELFTRLGTSFEALTRETAASRARIDELVKQLDALGVTGSAASQRRGADRT